MLESSLKKSGSYLLEEIFLPPDSKCLRLNWEAFEMRLNHGVLGSPFKRTQTVCAKTVTRLLRESMSITIHIK